MTCLLYSCPVNTPICPDESLWYLEEWREFILAVYSFILVLLNPAWHLYVTFTYFYQQFILKPDCFFLLTFCITLFICVCSFQIDCQSVQWWWGFFSDSFCKLHHLWVGGSRRLSSWASHWIIDLLKRAAILHWLSLEIFSLTERKQTKTDKVIGNNVTKM